jgi:hypothetical protein
MLASCKMGYGGVWGYISLDIDYILRSLINIIKIQFHSDFQNTICDFYLIPFQNLPLLNINITPGG